MLGSLVFWMLWFCVVVGWVACDGTVNGGIRFRVSCLLSLTVRWRCLLATGECSSEDYQTKRDAEMSQVAMIVSVSDEWEVEWS